MEYKAEIEDINDFFTNVLINELVPANTTNYVGATFSTMNYSELNTKKYDKSSDDTINNTKKEPMHQCLQIKYANMEESEYDIAKRKAILDRLHEEKIRKWRREAEQKKRVEQQQKLQRKREREEQIRNYRLYYVYHLYDRCFGE